jgi:Ni2+-binding GTPase involved in maturation of urease and hydrogenase
MVGVGKTSLAVKLIERVQNEFDFVIWRSLSYAPSCDRLYVDECPLAPMEGQHIAE